MLNSNTLLSIPRVFACNVNTLLSVVVLCFTQLKKSLEPCTLFSHASFTKCTWSVSVVPFPLPEKRENKRWSWCGKASFSLSSAGSRERSVFFPDGVECGLKAFLWSFLWFLCCLLWWWLCKKKCTKLRAASDSLFL